MFPSVISRHVHVTFHSYVRIWRDVDASSCLCPQRKWASEKLVYWQKGKRHVGVTRRLIEWAIKLSQTINYQSINLLHTSGIFLYEPLSNRYEWTHCYAVKTTPNWTADTNKRINEQENPNKRTRINETFDRHNRTTEQPNKQITE